SHGSRSEAVADALLRHFEIIEQMRERRELAVALAGAPKVAHHQRLILEVAVLAVPNREPREYSQHFKLALGTHPFEVAVEIGEVRGDRKPRAPRLLPVPDRPVDDALLFPGDVRVPQQGHEVVSDRSVHGVLKVQDSGTGLAYHEVARVV